MDRPRNELDAILLAFLRDLALLEDAQRAIRKRRPTEPDVPWAIPRRRSIAPLANAAGAKKDD